MAERVLITGGAGFIGSHIADMLLRAGCLVRVLDSLEPQVHGGAERPLYLAPDVELQRGDVRDADAVSRALHGVDAVIHLAARVGVGQSMYALRDYVGANSGGTAVLLAQLLEQPVARLVVASSMSIYGEGLYRDAAGNTVEAERTNAQLHRHEWELRDRSGEPLHPVPTPETKTPRLTSIYALTKHDQEHMCLLFGQAYQVPTVALRLFNVYGERQALSNPYTGVLAIFGARLLHERAPLIFEDGAQTRDFVHVHDVARAFRLALSADTAAGHALNIGSGRAVSIADLAHLTARSMGRDIGPEITGRYRIGDVRHCFADIGEAQRLLGYAPEIPLDAGIGELGQWLTEQQAEDRVETAHSELVRRGLAL